MSALPRIDTASGKSLSRASMLRPDGGAPCTKRAAELEARVARLRAELDAAEADLDRERNRLPETGDFVRCPLTNFFGQVIKVTPRPHGRPWVEIILYLSPGLPGHAAMDLFDSWELIDPPEGGEGIPQAAETLPKLPSVSTFKALDRPLAGQKPADEIEAMIGSLWAFAKSDAR